MVIIGGGAVLTRDPERPFIASGGVAAGDDGLILALGPVSRLKREYPGASFVDAGGGIIMPGLVDLHHHAYTIYSRGLTPRGNRPLRYMDILEGGLWRLDRAMNLEDVYHSASAAFLDCVRPVSYTHLDVYKRQHRARLRSRQRPRRSQYKVAGPPRPCHRRPHRSGRLSLLRLARRCWHVRNTQGYRQFRARRGKAHRLRHKSRAARGIDCRGYRHAEVLSQCFT